MRMNPRRDCGANGATATISPARRPTRRHTDCYNLARTASYAAAHGFDAFTTSLTVSPHKPSAKIFASSEDPKFLREDFKKREGFKLSVRRAGELGLYRQAYCGCEFSKRTSREELT